MVLINYVIITFQTLDNVKKIPKKLSRNNMKKKEMSKSYKNTTIKEIHDDNMGNCMNAYCDKEVIINY
jgi:hypothetical protein